MSSYDSYLNLPLVSHRYNQEIGRPAEHPERLWRQIFDTTHVRSNTRVVSIAYLLLQARWKVVKEVIDCRGWLR